MHFSLADYLDVVTPYVPPALLSPAAVEHMRCVTRELPPVSLVGFESTLASPDATADFAIGLTDQSRSRELFADHMARTKGDGGQLAAPGWNRFRAFTDLWADSTSRLYEGTGTVWLEWDLTGTTEAMPAPNVLFGVRGNDERRRLIEQGLHSLMGGPLVPQVQQQLVRCFDALPLDANIFQVGVMLARCVGGVRVCVFPVTVAQAGEYLAQIGWHGNVREMMDTLAPFGAFATRMALAVDVGAGVGPRIGLECYMEDRRRPNATPGWTALLNYLVAQGMCTAEKGAALLQWPGIQQTTEFMWARTFIRGLNHLKVVYAPGQPVTAKAYWGFAQGWSGAGA